MLFVLGGAVTVLDSVATAGMAPDGSFGVVAESTVLSHFSNIEVFAFVQFCRMCVCCLPRPRLHVLCARGVVSGLRAVLRRSVAQLRGGQSDFGALVCRFGDFSVGLTCGAPGIFLLLGC